MHNLDEYIEPKIITYNLLWVFFFFFFFLKEGEREREREREREERIQRRFKDEAKLKTIESLDLLSV
uniref:Bm14226 n=1 Tax=Brugia malayi TaxID=6279 RepID=A0A1I9G2Z9_BRUMA|nr:Bm14226 [Brugia malayi]